jgi:hypothetical protein
MGIQPPLDLERFSYQWSTGGQGYAPCVGMQPLTLAILRIIKPIYLYPEINFDRQQKCHVAGL